MTQATAWSVIGGCTVVTAFIKGIGPLALGGRELSSRFTELIALLAPAILAALVSTQALAHGRHLHVGANTAGVIAGGVIGWRGGSIITVVLTAILVTAGLRLIT